MKTYEEMAESALKRIHRQEHIKKRRFKYAAALTAAVLGMTSITAGAIAVFGRGSASVYYDSGAEQILESQGLIVSETKAAEHFEMTLDTLLADDFAYSVLLTVRPTDDAGVEFVEKQRSLPVEDRGSADISVFAGSGEQIYGVGGGTFCVPEGSDSLVIALWGKQDYEFRQKAPDGKLTVKISGSSIRLGDSFTSSNILSGLSFEITVKKNVEARRVDTADGTGYYISQIGFAQLGKSNKGLFYPNFIWKEGAFERLLARIGMSREEYDRGISLGTLDEATILMNGVHYGNGSPSFGGSGFSFSADSDMMINSEGDAVCSGERIDYYPFGCLIDLNDTEGVIIGKEKLIF